MGSDTTYSQSYGIHKGFINRADLVKKHWMLENNDYVELTGSWKDSGFTSIDENYFVVEKINQQKVSSSEAIAELQAFSRSTMRAKHGENYSHNVAFFASDRSAGWEYPILTQPEADDIATTLNVFDYYKTIRYAFASSFAYSLEDGVDFPFSNDPLYKSLMLSDGTLNIIDQQNDVEGVYAIAVKVPAVSQYQLQEEVIIAYKGTNPANWNDLVQDGKLTLANVGEWNEAWQRAIYDFCDAVISKYPPNRASVARGYQVPKASKSYNVVLTGHSLGGYNAIDAGVRTGIVTRVFSAPATKIVESYLNIAANTLRLLNVINYRIAYDPISTAFAGRHDENIVEFAAVSNNPLANHSLDNMINERLKPLLDNWQDKQARPQRLFITPDSLSGAGLTKRVNKWGDIESQY